MLGQQKDRHVGTANFALSLTIGLVLLARFHWIVHCFPGELSQELHQVLIAVKKILWGYIGVKQALETPLYPPSRSDLLLCKWHK